MAAFDDRYEDRLASNKSLAFDEIFTEDIVQDRYRTLVRFLADYATEGYAIRDFLTDRVAAQYDRYVELTTSADAALDLDVQLRIAMLDSVGFTLSFLHPVALFNHRDPSDEAVRQFTHLGILGKLADDALDFWDDLADDRINLLRGVVHRHPTEEARVLATAAMPAVRGTGWWRRMCPQSFSEFAALIAEQRAAITVKPLLLICDVMLAPMRRGATLIRSVPVGLRV
jgi:hypothetical protein